MVSFLVKLSILESLHRKTIVVGFSPRFLYIFSSYFLPASRIINEIKIIIIIKLAPYNILFSINSGLRKPLKIKNNKMGTMLTNNGSIRALKLNSSKIFFGEKDNSRFI